MNVDPKLVNEIASMITGDVDEVKLGTPEVRPDGNKFDNYMFFSNLKVIKEKVDAMLAMDQMDLDRRLSDGHGWACDHVTSSRDDIEEVYNWAISR